MTDAPKRRWLQFSLREVALLTLALGFGLGWYLKWRECAIYREDAAPINEGLKHMRSLPPNARSGQAQNAVILTDDGFVVEIVVKAQ